MHGGYKRKNSPQRILPKLNLKELCGTCSVFSLFYSWFMSKVRCLFQRLPWLQLWFPKRKNKTDFFNKIMRTPPNTQDGKQFTELLRKESSIEECLVIQPFLLSSSDIYKELVFCHELGVLARQHSQTFKSSSGTSSQLAQRWCFCVSSLMCQDSSFPGLPGKRRGKGTKLGFEDTVGFPGPYRQLFLEMTLIGSFDSWFFLICFINICASQGILIN